MIGKSQGKAVKFRVVEIFGIDFTDKVNRTC
jgi:hypothetical protein